MRKYFYKNGEKCDASNRIEIGCSKCRKCEYNEGCGIKNNSKWIACDIIQIPVNEKKGTRTIIVMGFIIILAMIYVTWFLFNNYP